MAANLMTRVLSILVRLFSVVEPLTPLAVSYFIRRYLRNWKKNNLILDYRTRTRRLGKLHYKIVVDLYLTPTQALRMLKQKLIQPLKWR